MIRKLCCVAAIALLTAQASFGLISKTIGSGKDFSGFDTACNWLQGQAQPLVDDYEFVADAGVYTPCALRAVNTGSRTLTFRPASGTVQLSGLGTGYAFYVESTNNVTLQGLVANVADTAGICYRGSANGIVRACSVDSTGVYGIYADQSDNLLIDTCTAHNGNIAGIRLDLSDNARIRRTWIDNSNIDGINISWSRDVRVDSSRVDGAQGYGICFNNSIRGRVRFDRVTAAGTNTGIMWEWSDTARVDSCFIAAGTWGIYFLSSPASVVRRCSVACLNSGIGTSGSYRVSIDSSIIWADGSYGVNFNFSDGCRVLASSVAGNAANGVSFEHSGHDSIVQCDVATTGSSSVRVYSTPVSVGNFVANNLLRDWTTYGIYLLNQDSARFYDNTISGPGALGIHYGIRADSSTNMVSKGNIMLDTSGTGAFIYYLYRSSSFLPGGSDFNDLYCPPGGQLASLNGTFYSNLAAWQASPGNPDTNSLSTNPLFKGGSDYSLDSTSPCRSAGTPIPGITTDLFGNLRDASFPSMGAIEWSPTPPGPFSLLSPADGALNQPTGLSLFWSPSANADTYLLYFGRDSSALPALSRQTDTSYACSGLLLDTTYYWKVVATSNAGGTRASPCWRFRVNPDTVWTPEPQPPVGGKGKTISDGGAMASLPGNGDTTYSFLLKGNNTCEFYVYNSATGVWTALESIPRIGLSGKKKTVKKGSALVAVAGKLYAFKGNSTNEFWCYTPFLPGPSGIAAGGWQQYTDVPGDKKCKDGTSATTAVIGGVPYVYLLKGGTNEFYRNSVAGKGAWETETGAPLPPSGKVYKTGSAIVYYPDDKVGAATSGRIFALKGSYNEFYAYDLLTGRWTDKAPMPLTTPPSTKKTKVKAGAGLAYCASPKLILALKGNKTVEYWKYDAGANAWARGVDVPLAPSGKKVGAGGSITCAGGVVNITKGNKTMDFYSLPVSESYGRNPLVEVGGSKTIQDGREMRNAEFALRIAPTPLTAATTITYALAQSGNVSLKLYNIAGKLVSTLASGYHPAGSYSFGLSAVGCRLSAGVYLLKYETEGYRMTQKLVIE